MENLLIGFYYALEFLENVCVQGKQPAAKQHEFLVLVGQGILLHLLSTASESNNNEEVAEFTTQSLLVRMAPTACFPRKFTAHFHEQFNPHNGAMQFKLMYA